MKFHSAFFAMAASQSPDSPRTWRPLTMPECVFLKFSVIVEIYLD